MKKHIMGSQKLIKLFCVLFNGNYSNGHTQ